MAIINMAHNSDFPNGNFPEGSYCPFDYGVNGEFVHIGNHTLSVTSSTALILYKTHQGLCLFEREANFHDDSDFYMMVWNSETKAPQEICFASTRGWSYPCLGSAVDATPEVFAAYEAWKVVATRKRTIENKLSRRNRAKQIAKDCRLPTYHHVEKLYNALPGEKFERAIELLKVKKFRSAFRASMAGQIRAWVIDPTPKFPRPLSPKQLECL